MFWRLLTILYVNIMQLLRIFIDYTPYHIGILQRTWSSEWLLKHTIFYDILYNIFKSKVMYQLKILSQYDSMIVCMEYALIQKVLYYSVSVFLKITLCTFLEYQYLIV